jgi:predicted nucleic acid-binding protein
MAQAFLDTNILLRHLLQDIPSQSARSSAYLSRIERGELRVHISDFVVFETVFLLERTYEQPRDKVRDVVLGFLHLPGVLLSGKRRFGRVFDLYVGLKISFAEAYHVVLMEQLKTTQIVSYDRDFDKVGHLTRIEP